MRKNSTTYTDYQQSAKAFKRGMRVYHFMHGNSGQPGIVVAVYPAIGMVDVQYPHGSQRVPVEELIIDTSNDNTTESNDITIPGGLGTVPVSARVASRYIKKAIYWKNLDRKYKLCRGEDPNRPTCPRCKHQMGKTVYKRQDGVSERLFACKNCLFIIKTSDVEGVN